MNVAPIAAVAAQVRDAHASGASQRIVGAGTWLGAGQPVRSGTARLDMRPARGITEYVPGDLTLTALAGTPLGDLHDATQASGQRLAFDPYGTDAGTIGATVATSSAGPSAAAFGTPRDQVLGLTFVTGTGEIVRGGGRVVKNVAGFDLVRLATGAWGTLGVIVEVTMRLRALPEADETLMVPVDADDDAGVGAMFAAVRALPFTFDACELLDAGAARALHITQCPAGALLVRCAGSTGIVKAMRASIASIGSMREGDPTIWTRLRAVEPDAGACVRLSHAPSQAGATWAAAGALARATGGFAHMAAGRTVTRVVCAPNAGEAPGDFGNRLSVTLEAALAGFDGTVIGERLPTAAWESPVLHRPRADASRLAPLMRGVRDAFDPGRLLNPGILGTAGGET